MYVRVIPLDGVKLTQDVIKTAHIEAGRARRARFSADSFSSFAYKDGYRFHIRGAGADLCHVLVSAVEPHSVNKGHLLIRPYYTVGGHGYLRNIADVVDRPSSFTRDAMTQYLATPYTDALRFVYTKLPDLPPPSNIDTVPRVLHNEREARRFTDTYVMPKVYQMLKQNAMDREHAGRAYPALDRIQRSRGFTKAFIYEATPLFLEGVYGDNSVPSGVIAFIRIISLHIVDKILQVLDTFTFGKTVTTYFKQVTPTYPSVMTVGGAYKRIRNRIAYCVREPDDGWMEKGVRTSYFYMDSIPVSVVNIGVSRYAYEGTLQPGENQDSPGSIWLLGVPDEVPYDGTAASEIAIGFERFISCKVIEEDDDAGVLVYATQYTHRQRGTNAHADKTDEDDFIVRVYAFKIPVSTNVLRNEPHYEFFGRRVTPPKKEWVFKRDKYPQLLLREGVLPIKEDPQQQIQSAQDASVVLMELTYTRSRPFGSGFGVTSFRYVVSDASPLQFTAADVLYNKVPIWAHVGEMSAGHIVQSPGGHIELDPDYGGFVGQSHGVWGSLAQSVFGFMFAHPKENGDYFEYAIKTVESREEGRDHIYVSAIVAGFAFSTKNSVHIMNVLPIKFKGGYYLLPHRRVNISYAGYVPHPPPPTARLTTSVVFVAPKQDLPLRTGGSRTKLKAFDSGNLAFSEARQNHIQLTVQAHQALMLEAESTPVIEHESTSDSNITLTAQSSMDGYRADINETARSYGSGTTSSKRDKMAGTSAEPDDFRYGVYYSGFMHAQDISERHDINTAMHFSSAWRYSYMFGMSPGVKKGYTFQLHCSGSRDESSTMNGRETRGFVLPIYHDNWGTHIASKVHCTISDRPPREEVVRSAFTALEESGVRTPYAPIVESNAFSYEAEKTSNVTSGDSDIDSSGFHRTYSYTANRRFKSTTNVDMPLPYQTYYTPTTTMAVVPPKCFVGNRYSNKDITFTDLQLTAYAAIGSAYLDVVRVELDMSVRTSLRFSAGGWRKSVYSVAQDEVPSIDVTLRAREFTQFKDDDRVRTYKVKLVNVLGAVIGRSESVSEEQADLRSRAMNSYMRVGVPAKAESIPRVLFCKDIEGVSSFAISFIQAPIVVVDDWAVVHALLLGAREIPLVADPEKGEVLDRIEDIDASEDARLWGQIHESIEDATALGMTGYAPRELHEAFKQNKVIGIISNRLYANLVRDMTGGFVHLGLSRGSIFTRRVSPPFFPVAAAKFASIMRTPQTEDVDGGSSGNVRPLNDGADMKIPPDDERFFVYVGEEEDPPLASTTTYKRAMVSGDYRIQFTTELRTITTGSGYVFEFAYAVPAFHRQVLYNSPGTMFDPFGVLYG